MIEHTDYTKSYKPNKDFSTLGVTRDSSAVDEQLSPDLICEMVADVGLREHFHLGGCDATQELVELCHLDTAAVVLDIGFASGRTACHISQRYGCRVVGVDILQRMIDRSNERAKREGIKGRVSFRVWNVPNRPFEDNLFDLVIGEFITKLLDDKRRAARRVSEGDEGSGI